MNQVKSEASTGQQGLAAKKRREVISRELAWHESEAQRRTILDRWLYDPPAFGELIDATLSYLDGQPGELTLDLACGEGKETLIMARKGWRVVGVDLSLTQLRQAKTALHKADPELKVALIQANAEQLPFAKESFRIVHGKAILHHLDLDIASREMHRVMKHDGRATFAEPLAYHPLFWLGRRFTPKFRTQDEKPLVLSELKEFASTFALSSMEVSYLFAPFAYPVRLLPMGEPLFRRLYTVFERFDSWLLDRIKPLWVMAWYGTVKVQKRNTP